MNIQWKTIGELTDKTILGTSGLASGTHRRKSRAILINPDGKCAIIHEQASNLHMLPGGSIEPGEDEISALVREISEETGCTCDTVTPLGVVSENRFHAGITRLSYFFVVRTKTLHPVPHFTPEETSLGTTLKWCSMDEALRLIKDAHHDAPQKKFIQARDLIALTEYLSNPT